MDPERLRFSGGSSRGSKDGTLLDEISINLRNHSIRVRVGRNLLSPEQFALMASRRRDLYSAGYLRGMMDALSGHDFSQIAVRLLEIKD